MLEDAESAFVGAKPSGLVRVDVHGTQARHFLLPGLPHWIDPEERLAVLFMSQVIGSEPSQWESSMALGQRLPRR